MTLKDNIKKQLEIAACALHNNDLDTYQEVIHLIGELSKLLEEKSPLGGNRDRQIAK